MRRYTDLGNDKETRMYLDELTNGNTSVCNYRKAFTSLGVIIGSKLKNNIGNPDRVLIACAVEDADWLASGLIDGASLDSSNIAVFWNKRISTISSTNDRTEIAPIVKNYMDITKQFDTVIVIKSIINTSCVIKTQLMRLLEYYTPKRIIIAAPVMYKYAEDNIKNEFPQDVISKMSFFAFAVDDECVDGIVKPGIGGVVYCKLGLGNGEEKNGYMPSVVKKLLVQNH